MSDTDQPATKPKRQLTLKPAYVLVAVVLFVAGFFVIQSLTAEPEPPSTSEEQVCALLRTGADTASLVSTDAWRTWPEHYSVSTRERIVRSSAQAGGCGPLAS